MNEITISQDDITSQLCKRCGACCRIFLTIKNTDSRYRKWLRVAGVDVRPPAQQGMNDCCPKKHDIKIDAGNCQHLQVHKQGNQKHYSCTLYDTDNYPELCRDYDCVSWAKRDNTYNQSNRILLCAQKALDQMVLNLTG